MVIEAILAIHNWAFSEGMFDSHSLIPWNIPSIKSYFEGVPSIVKAIRAMTPYCMHSDACFNGRAVYVKTDLENKNLNELSIRGTSLIKQDG